MNIQEQILQVINDNLDNGKEVGYESSIKASGIDSMGVLMIVNAIEDELNVKLEFKKLYNIDRVGVLIQIIKQKIEEK